jgi:hypothetical protein
MQLNPLALALTSAGMRRYSPNSLFLDGSQGLWLDASDPSTVTQDWVLPGGFNAVSAGPIMIGEGVTVTISDHSTWSIN